MGDSETLSVRVSEDLKEQLDAKENLNTSGLVRSLLESYLLTGDTVEVALQRRLDDAEQELNQLRREKGRLETEIEKKQREIDKLQERIEDRQKQVPEEVVEFAERIKAERFELENLAPGNPAVKNHAQKAGIEPAHFVEAVEDRL